MNNNQPVLFTTNHNNVFGSQVPDEAGIYNVVVSPESIAKNSNNGNPMASMDYVVMDGTQKGKHIYDRLVWTNTSQENHDLSIKRFNTVMMAAGFQDGIDIHTIPEFVQKMLRQRLAVETEWQKSEYNGNTYLVVTRYRMLQANGSQPNGQKRPQNNNNQTNNGFGTANQANNKQLFNNNNGAPIDIDNDQLPF
ncbi:DUF669 domain-containing protein [Limosilactobacillus reuteri]|uniref:DUF669 domain-containing protein n=1 Tax=Limosilactobacillus reuteri TaxID=1598 RepID=A0A517D6H6_LIMRT|nr:DUF669 domain-containing protein [Limosilactobacillus reuteri]QDR72940.1 DUF669 domain-containing protein [Limosilactobacillus reuteri]